MESSQKPGVRTERAIGKGDCGLNVCVVPPHIYVSLFARWDNALRQGSEDKVELQSLLESMLWIWYWVQTEMSH